MCLGNAEHLPIKVDRRCSLSSLGARHSTRESQSCCFAKTSCSAERHSLGFPSVHKGGVDSARQFCGRSALLPGLEQLAVAQLAGYRRSLTVLPINENKQDVTRE